MEFKTTMSNSLGRFNWKLYLALLVTAVLPTVYTTVRINFLGDLLGDWGFSGSIQTLGYDKAHCEPSDEVKMNQWVCALTL